MRLRRRGWLLVTTGSAALLMVGAAAIHAHAASGAGGTPRYGLVSVEREEPRYLYRSMPALQQVSWTNAAGATRTRFVRSFQISADDRSLRTRIQYHTGGSMTNRANWRDALDSTGRRLLETTPYAKMNNTFRATDGTTVTIDEQARMDGRGHFLARRSTADGGVHWSSRRAPLDLAGARLHPCARGRAFQRVIRLPDRSLVLPFYAAHKADSRDCAQISRTWSAAHLLVSRDEGASWRRAATVFSSQRNTYTEASVARRADGRLIMISRYDVVSGGSNYAKLAYRVTTAPVSSAAALAAASWGPWTAVTVPGAVGYPHGSQGVAPVLHTMDRGVLMLAFGRPGNNIAFSYDGGVHWTRAHPFYGNAPTSGCTRGYKLRDGTYYPCASLGSSGYLGVAVTSPRTAYVMGDNCHTNWGCAGGYRHPHGTDDKLWYATVSLN